MRWDADTIVAPASPPGGSGRGILRLSGPESARIAADLARLQPPAGRQSGLAGAGGLQRGRWSGRLCTEAGPLPVAFYCMPAPASYTREDVVELHLPGGPAAVRAGLAACLAAGARLAEAGEFTFRAFLNGRLDLSQAEAIERLIAAGDESERRAALAGLAGELSARVRSWRERLVSVAGEVEAALDFEEDDPPPPERQDAGRAGALRRLRAEVAALAGTAAGGRDRAGALPVFLCGLTNAGKSSLLNALAGRAEALVSAERSTTRDRLEVELELAGFPFLLQDGPGLDAAAGADAADPAAVASARRLAGAGAQGGLLLLVVDAADPQPELLRALAAELPSLPILLAWNKTDLPAAPASPPVPEGLEPVGAVAVSAATGAGLERLRELLAATAARDGGAAAADLGARIRGELRAVVAHLDAALGLTEEEGDLVLLAEELRGAHQALGHILGEGYAEAVLASIFSRFCIGK
jgi:tRNA modification GTPase